jgi:hypothetical protein
MAACSHDDQIGSLLVRNFRDHMRRASGPDLATVLFVIERFRFGETGPRVLQELGLSLLVAEAIGLAPVDRIDRIIRLHVLVQRKAHCAHQLAFRGGNRGEP